MDLSEYKNSFIAEARDSLEVINDCLVILEKDSDDSENINKLFRSFHTLKGNAASMEYIKFSELAHSLEDLLSKIRDKVLKPNDDIMKAIFDGCDVLEEGLDMIMKDKSEDIDVDDIINAIKENLDEKEAPVNVIIPETVELSAEEKQSSNDFLGKGMNVLRLIIIFENNNPLKRAKMLVILRNMSEYARIIKTTPNQDEIRAGRFNNEVEVIFATEKSYDDVKKEIDVISGIKEFKIMKLEDKYVKTIEAYTHEKEVAKAEIVSKHRDETVKQIQSVKVDMGKLDKLMNLIGELHISNMRIQDMSKKKEYDKLKVVLPSVERITSELQTEIIQVRMIPIGNIFGRFPRMIRDLAKKEEKKVNLILEGQEIEFDRTVLEEIGDPLVHLLRNCVDHGIESPAERIARGKSEEGTVKIIARREKSNAVIEVVDDGAGIDPQIVKEACIRKGIVTEEETRKMTDKELQMLIFHAGASTNKVVTEVSGRGVGMDVVLNKTKELGGILKFNSVVGKGTTVTMQLPLTVAIIKGLLVTSNNEVYIIPISVIDQIVNISVEDIKTISGNEVFIHRGQSVPILRLNLLTGNYREISAEKSKYHEVVLINKDNEKIGLIVDSIISQQQVLIKSLQDIVRGTAGIAGYTILGDGSVAIILDIDSLFERNKEI